MGVNVSNILSKIQVVYASDYKDVIKMVIRNHTDLRGYQGKIAKAIGCHPSFLSQVIKTEIHINPDHAAKMAAFFQFDHVETDYFIELVNLSRAGSAELRKHLLNKLELLRKKKIESEKQIEQSVGLSEELKAAYYSAWTWGAIHVLTSIPAYQTVSAIAKRLGLPPETVQSTLEGLNGLALVNRAGDRWVSSNKSVYLKNESGYLIQHLQNWRQQALLSAQKRKPGNLHYSSTHALSSKDVENLRELALKFIEESKRKTDSSPEEELVCINLDFFLV